MTSDPPSPAGRTTNAGEHPPPLFFQRLQEHGNHPAIIQEGGLRLSYRTLAERADALRPPPRSDGRRSLGFLFCRNTIDHLAVYLGALRANAPVALLNPGLAPPLQEKLIQRYRPDWIVVPSDWEPDRTAGLGYKPRATAAGVPFLIPDRRPQRPIPHRDLAVVLSTSGSTGSGKIVRLTAANIAANAESIRCYMDLRSDDRPLANLPLYYSFGLSVVNSHLAAGAALLFGNEGFLSPGFWKFAETEGASVLAGVPFHFESWRRLGLDKLALPGLRIIAQAGGRLSEDLQRHYLRFAEEHRIRFFVMYGQTEASPRISYVPPELLARKIGTIGRPVPGGRLRIDPENSELIYEGPNVMMGYADGPDDLRRGDDLHGVLRTGDVGAVDEDGIFRVVGRLKRFIKLFGERINLDEFERDLQDLLGIPIACTGKDGRLVIAVEQADRVDAVRDCLHRLYRFRSTGISIAALPALPRLESGKVDYRRLLEEHADA